ncbi:MAG: site-2 protease family protein [Chloroflexi bacterium]|nr:site-2 protease family protein [Chloroflexota bacterium]
MATPDHLENDDFTPIVQKYLRISDVTWGDSRQKFHVRYRGELTRDSAEAYDAISAELKAYKFTVLFRDEEGQHTILLVKGLIEPQPSNPWINLGLFLATLLSMLLIGAFNVYDGPPVSSQSELYRRLFQNLASGFPYAGSLLAILLAHEFGHYLAGRYHKTAVSLPYFIPLPLLGSFGTLGAAIRLKEPPKNKRVLLDIGIAGPLAGLVVAIPIVLFGLSNSELGTVPNTAILEGNSILYLVAKYLALGEWLPMPISFEGVHPFVYWARYLLTGLPVPIGGRDVLLNSVAWAGWAGLLVTAINLIPTGQLDGGHTLYSLIGDKVSKLRPFVLAALMLMGLLYSGWWLWALLIYFLGRYHAEPYDQITQLDPRRKLMAIFTLIVFLLVFIPVPLRTIGIAGAGF